MLSAVTASRFERAMSTGRTRPSIFTCKDGDGNESELVLKFSAGCDLRERALLVEALAAMIAADLELPVPEPFIVWMGADVVATIPDQEIREKAKQSIGWNFGSRKLPPGFSTIPTDYRPPASLISAACEILAFDTFILNPDRTVANPNCLSNGRKFAIIDHEASLFMEGLIGWQPPWEVGGIAFSRGLSSARRHVFLEAVRSELTDLQRLEGAFCALTPARLAEYRAVLPSQWIENTPAIDRIFEYVQTLKDNIEPAIQNLKKALQ